MRQLAKKLESYKSTAKYIKQASNEPQATQVHLLNTSAQNNHPINIKETKENQSQNHLNTDTSMKRKKLTDHHKNVRIQTRTEQTSRKMS